MIKYGLISETDARCLEKTIDLICNDVKEGKTIYYTEIGVYAGQTGLGLSDYIATTGRDQYFTGIDNEKDGEPRICFYDNMVIGNSDEVYNQLEDESQHLIFVDGCHCFAHVVSDFFCYADKVKVGGYIAFHDTGKHIKPFKDFQHGDKENPDAYISVRKGLKKVGLFNTIPMYEFKPVKYFSAVCGHHWELIFDEEDVSDLAGGICVFKKIA